MKSLRIMLTIVLLSFCRFAISQSDMHHSLDKAAPTESQKSFTALKNLAGTWHGAVTIDPPPPGFDEGTRLEVSMRVTSRGNALVHEFHELGKPDDPSKTDHPVTMLYVDGDRLLLTHYCDAGNRPRMVARTSPDGKKVEFDFLDLSGGDQHGHMYHAVFTTIDDNHHIEDWTYLMPGDKPMHAHVDLKRVQ